MLAADVKIIDIDPAHVEYFYTTLMPAAAEKSSTLYIFYEGNRLIHAVHTRRGPLPELRFSGAHKLDEIARRESADSVVCIEKSALQRLSTVVGNRVRWDDPLLFQILEIVDSVREESGAGIHFWPSPAGAPPKITRRGVRFVTRFLPRRALIMFVVFDEEGDVRASAIVGGAGGEIDLVTTTEGLGVTGLAGLPLNERARRLNAAAARVFRRPTVSLFMDDDVFRHLANHRKPAAALLGLHARGWVKIEPFPLKLRALLRLANFVRT